MPTAINPDTGERREGLSLALVTYYRGEGWEIEDDENDSPQFPILFPNGERLDPEAVPVVDGTGDEGADAGTEGEQGQPDQTADQDGGGALNLDAGSPFQP